MIARGPDLFAVSLHESQLLVQGQVLASIRIRVASMLPDAFDGAIISALTECCKAFGSEGPQTILSRSAVDVVLAQKGCHGVGGDWCLATELRGSGAWTSSTHCCLRYLTSLSSECILHDKQS